LPLPTYSAPGGLRQGPGRAAESAAGPKWKKTWGHDVRVLLSTDRGRGGEPLVGPAVRLRALGAEVRVCAPPDWSGEDSER
jgi:vancomycin aglycone glucosyltransferase